MRVIAALECLNEKSFGETKAVDVIIIRRDLWVVLT